MKHICPVKSNPQKSNPPPTKISWNALTGILVQNCSITFKDNLSQNFFFSTQSFFKKNQIYNQSSDQKSVFFFTE